MIFSSLTQVEWWRQGGLFNNTHPVKSVSFIILKMSRYNFRFRFRCFIFTSFRKILIRPMLIWWHLLLYTQCEQFLVCVTEQHYLSIFLSTKMSFFCCLASFLLAVWFCIYTHAQLRILKFQDVRFFFYLNSNYHLYFFYLYLCSLWRIQKNY